DGSPNTDIGVPGYNSDHRSVVASYSMGAPVVFGDFTGDGLVNSADWAILRNNQFGDLSSFTAQQAYLHGDLNGDKRNDHADFVLFKSTYQQLNGAAAFAALLKGVPEPASWMLAMLAGIVVVRCTRHQRRNAQAS